MAEKKVKVSVWLSREVHEVLRLQMGRTGRSLSSLVEEAVRAHLFLDELQIKMR